MRLRMRVRGLWRLKQARDEMRLRMRVRGFWRLKQAWEEMRLRMQMRGLWRLQQAWREFALRWEMHFGKQVWEEVGLRMRVRGLWRVKQAWTELGLRLRVRGLWRLKQAWTELGLRMRVRGLWRLEQAWEEMRLRMRVRGLWRLRQVWREFALRWEMHFGSPLTGRGLRALAWRFARGVMPLATLRSTGFLLKAALAAPRKRTDRVIAATDACCAGRPWLLMICAHEPTMDPRIGWEAEGASEQFEVTVLGFNRENGSELEEQTGGGYRTVRLRRNDLPPMSYFSRFPELIPAPIRNVLAAAALVLSPAAAIVEVAVRLAGGAGQILFRAGRRLKPAHGGTTSIGSARLLDRIHFILGNLRMQFAPAAELFSEYIDRLPTKPDVIHCNDLDTLLAGVLAKHRFGCGLVYDAHEFWPVADSLGMWIDRTFFLLLERFLLRWVDATVTVNPLLAEAMRDTYRLPRVYSVPNVEPWLDWRPALKSKSPMNDIAAGRVKFLFQGRFTKARGIEEIIHAWSGVNGDRAALFLRGPDNPWRQSAIALADSLGLLGRSVYFLDAVSEAELVVAAAEADVGIIPYLPIALNERLACPNKLSQYLHAGLMVLTNDLPYVRSVIEEAAAGIWYKSSDLSTLAAAANRIADDPELLRGCQKNALVFAQVNYNWQRHGTLFLDLYASAVPRLTRNELYNA